MRSAVTSVAIATALFLMMPARDARAQGAPTAEGSIGYAYLRDVDNDLSFPLGWVATLAGNATSWLGLVGEVGGSYKTFSEGDADLSLKLHTFAAGPRLMVTANSPVAPFAQLLFGVAHGSADLGVPGASLVVRGTGFLVQGGFGIDLNASPQRALRLQLDVRDLHDDGETNSQWRMAVSLVFRN